MEDLAKNLSNLLSKVGDGHERARRERENGEREGKYYNVFNALGIQKKELRHSAFIADLLNPNGAHGAGDKFLRAFLKRVPIKDTKEHLKEDYLSVKPGRVNVHTEFYVEKYNGRIDIIAEDGENAIIIENKIDAGDQEAQLLRYYNYAKEREEKGILRDYKLIYLTKNGHEPTKVSTGNSEDVKRDCICMSYEKHIIPWLKECLEIASNLPVKELINQYIYVIKGLTHTTMEDKELEKVTEIAIKDGNLAATAAILQARYKIRDALITRYIFEPLKEEFKGFKCEIDTVSLQIKLSKDGWKKGCIQIMTDKAGWNEMYIRVKGELVAKQKLECFRDDPNEYGCTYGYEYIPRPWWSWESPASYVDIKNGKIAKWLIEKINAIIEELGKRKIEL